MDPRITLLVSAVVPVACSSALGGPDVPDLPEAGSAPRVPRGDRLPPPRLDGGVLVRWEGDCRAVELPLRDALRLARLRTVPATIEAPGVLGEIQPGGKGWTLIADRKEAGK